MGICNLQVAQRGVKKALITNATNTDQPASSYPEKSLLKTKISEEVVYFNFFVKICHLADSFYVSIYFPTTRPCKISFLRLRTLLVH